MRPAKKFFNAQDVTQMGGYVGSGRMSSSFENYSTYEGNFYDSEGYMVKEMKVGNTVVACTEDTAPTLEELQEFRKRDAVGEDGEEGREENDQSLLDELSELQKDFNSSTASKKANHGILLGDTVKVVEGDLIGMMGKVIFIDDTTVKISPSSDLGIGDVEFLVDQVRKHLEVGKHVRVVDGRYVDETGVIVAVEVFEGEATAILLTDLTAKEISVRVSQLQESADVSTGQEKLHGYELYDLVALSGGGSVNEVGVIVRVGKEEFSVMTNQGPRDVRPEELRGKRNSSSMRAVALDVGGVQIRVGDSVNVIDGQHKNKSATIKHIHKAQLFLHSQQKVDNGGIFIARARTCSLLAGTRAGGNKAQAATSVKFGGRRRPTAGDDSMMTKTVRVQQGQWKGYVGIVVNATDTHVMVELHSRLKKVNVLRNKVIIVGDKWGKRDQDEKNVAAAAMNANSQGLTPFMGSMTPQLGGMTPMNPGGLTPGGGGGMTPLNATHYGDGDDEENVWIPGGLDGATPTTANSTPLSALENGSASAGWTPTSGNMSDNNTPGWTPQTDMTPNSEISTPTGDATPTTHDSSTAYTPVSMSSVTPVSTPGQEGENAWFIERVHVKLQGKEESYVLVGVNTLTNTARAVGEETGLEKVVRVDEVVERTEPITNDRVLVFQGAMTGSEGDLVCIDGNDAIFRTEDGQFKIVDVKDVAKIGTAN